MTSTEIRTNVRGVEIQGQAYGDASGAPCVVAVSGFRFAMDFLGEVKVNQLGEIKAPRRERLVAVSRARAAYQSVVDGLGQDWLTANIALYV